MTLTPERKAEIRSELDSAYRVAGWMARVNIRCAHDLLIALDEAERERDELRAKTQRGAVARPPYRGGPTP